MAIQKYKTRYILATIGLLMMFAGRVSAKLADTYNEKNPINMACDMEFAPYEYRNDNGEASGLNVDIAKEIAHGLNLPITFEMKEWNTVLNEMKNGKVDLMLVASLDNDIPGLYYSKLTVCTYKMAIAFKQGTKPIEHIKDIPHNAKVVFKLGDYCYEASKKAGLTTTKVDFNSPKYALYGLEKGSYDYFIYCDLPLKWHIRQYHLNDIQVRLLDAPGKTFRFVSNDKQLLTAIDDQLVRIQQTGDLNRMKSKWLVYNNESGRLESKFLMAVFVLGVIVVALILFNRLVSRRVKRILQETFEMNKVLGDALLASRNNVISHNLLTHRIVNVSGNWLPKQGLSESEFRELIHPSDRDKVTFLNVKESNAKNLANNCQYRWNVGTPDNPVWRIVVNQPAPEIDNRGRLISIISTVTDVTEVRANQVKRNELSNRYTQIFDNSMVGFALYDAEGNLIESNAQLKKILLFDVSANRVFYESTNLFEIDSVKDVYYGREGNEYVSFCTRVMPYGTHEAQYLEVRIRHIGDEDGKVVYHMVTITNNNEERANFLKNRDSDMKIRAVSKQIQKYETELRYLLESAHMRVWSASIADNEARFFKDLRSYETKMTIEEFVGKVVREEDKDLALRLADVTYNKCQSVMGQIKIKDLFRDGEGERWYSINSVPNYDTDGTLLGSFGLIRDVTRMVDSQEKLKEETARANDSDQQKSAFLANMSHEIRTPLNAIVGFCDLLQAVDEPEEKKEFMRIIRNNCDMLLMLIDDILTLSTIDSAESQLRFKDIDFAPAFDDMCTSLAQRVATKPALEFINENPYAKIETSLDKDRLQQVLTNFVTNAVKNTEQGHIKVGLNIENKGIRIYCEDTGCGIPQDKCDQIFQRFVKLNDFVQGAGLGLSICKKIAEMYHGKIGVNSKVDVGSTFWLWIPCNINNIEKKEE